MQLNSALLTHDELLRLDFEYIRANLEREFEEMAGKKLLITGGAGFLGYYLILSVLHWNLKARSTIHVTVYDNFIRGVPGWLKALEGSKHLTLVAHDMTQPLPTGVPDFDFIIHAASIASPTFYRRYPIETIDANVNGLRNLLDYCIEQKDRGKPLAGLLFFSTSEIYGDPPSEMIPTAEDYRGFVSCTGPRACYDESKRLGETLCVTFARQYDLPIKIVRPFNNYGPGLKISDGRVVPDFARDVLNERDIVMYSDGSPTRTFCYSADAIIGYYKVLMKGQAAEAYNIGMERPEISIAELAEKVIRTARDLFGYAGKLVRKPSQETDYLADNPSRRCPTIAKARAHLGYEPEISVDEGLRRSLIWYHYNQEA